MMMMNYRIIEVNRLTNLFTKLGIPFSSGAEEQQ